MKRLAHGPVTVLAVFVAIGCGGSRPQEATADPEPQAQIEQAIEPAQAPADAEPSAGEGTAVVTGTILLTGTPPEMKKIHLAADPVCVQQHTDPVYAEDVVVNDNGTLRNVFVYVKEGVSGAYPTPTEPVVLDQTGCAYQPRVLGIQVNQPLQIVNSDPTLHNINVKPQANRPFNLAQPVQGMKTEKVLTKPEIMVPLRCNVHPWMRAYLGVLEHPFFSVSGDDGSFTIAGLPAGRYEIEAWHETYGAQTQHVSVADGETQTVDFSYSAQ